MITLISFDEALVIEREEAKKLKLNYEDKKRFGRSMNYNKRTEPMTSGNYYVDELYMEEIDGNKKYYRDETKSKEVSEYYRYERLDDKDWVYVEKENHLVDINYFAVNCRFPFRIVKAIKSEEPTINNITSILSDMEEKFLTMNKIADKITSQSFNEKVNVHVGGGLIVTYNELKLLEDSCTDTLQLSLNDGWRIIAVCVQPDQRRPDYILGRYNSNMDTFNNSGALRK